MTEIRRRRRISSLTSPAGTPRPPVATAYAIRARVAEIAVTTVVLDGRCVEIEGQSHVEVRGLRIQFCDGAGDHDSRGIYVVGEEAGPAVEDIVLADNHIYSTRSSAIGVWGVRGGRNPGDFRRVRGVLIEGNLIDRAVEGGSNEQITIANGATDFEVRRNAWRVSERAVPRGLQSEALLRARGRR